jgi:hypothetical protein
MGLGFAIQEPEFLAVVAGRPAMGGATRLQRR